MQVRTITANIMAAMVTLSNHGGGGLREGRGSHGRPQQRRGLEHRDQEQCVRFFPSIAIVEDSSFDMWMGLIPRRYPRS